MSQTDHSAAMGLGIGPAVGDLVAGALALAQRPERESPSAVHEIRVTLKRLRAAARLAEPLVGRETFRRADDAFRDAGRLLAGRRDADVLAATMRRVVKRAPKGDRAVILAIGNELPLPAAAPPADWPGVITRIREGAAALDAALAPTGGCVDVAPGLRGTYRKARRFGKWALRSGVPEDAHRWRRWVKHLLYQAHLLEAAVHKPAMGKKRMKRLTRLGRLLGTHHDLALLRAAAEQIPSSNSPARDRLLAVVGALETELLARAGKLSGKTLDDKPERFIEQAAVAVDKARGC